MDDLNKWAPKYSVVADSTPVGGSAKHCNAMKVVPTPTHPGAGVCLRSEGVHVVQGGGESRSAVEGIVIMYLFITTNVETQRKGVGHGYRTALLKIGFVSQPP